MAPFSRGSVLKGRVSKNRPGQKNGRNGRPARGELFESSRLKDITDEAQDESAIVPEDFDEGKESFQDSSDEDSTHGDAASINPYNSLLQSLAARSKAKPKRSRTKESAPDASPAPAQENAALPDQIKEQPEDIDADPLEEREDHDSDDQVNDLDDEDPNASGKDGWFEQHVGSPPESDLQQHIRDVESSSLQTSKIDLDSEWRAVVVSSNISRYDDIKFQHIPHKLSPRGLGIKSKLSDKAETILRRARGVETYWASLIFSYVDVLFHDRNFVNADILRQLASLHALNHVLKTRDRVIKNNERTARNMEADDAQFCDQGFTRPKVLFLLPTRQSCYRVVTSLMSLYNPETQENKKRFKDSYGDTGEPISKFKPQDFRELFDGNDDDMFRVGLKFTRKAAKFFSQFYNSDIIFASPLGLRMAIGDERSKKQDYDFLSSIELVIVDQTDALLMQNWEHVEYIFEHLNLQPKEAHGCDFARVRPWYLDGHSRYVRQTVVLTAYNTPEINKLFNYKMLNFAGKFKIGRSVRQGLISAPNALFKQTFYRFAAAEPSSEPDARFKYFTTKMLPQIAKRARDNPGHHQGTLIFIPSYMDFVRVRNFLANSTVTRDIPFGSMSEYTPTPEVARARSHFIKGKHEVILYTSRLHHFRRYQIKGAKNVIFYGLPDNPVFYKEISSEFPALGVAAGKLDPSEVGVKILFSKWDALRLERIVGTERVGTILREKTGDIFEFIP